jgi:RNA polymerase sigma factor (sigma-70 family)
MIRCVQEGNEHAATTLYKAYEPQIRRIVRLRLGKHPLLMREIDSSGICQSVFKSFFFRLRLGAYDLESPAQLAALLATMANNKVVNSMHAAYGQGRDIRRNVGGLDQEPADRRVETPSQQVARHELYQQAIQLMAPEERRIQALREEGMSWQSIAQELGGTAEGRRKEHRRALDRIGHQLGVEESAEG